MMTWRLSDEDIALATRVASLRQRSAVRASRPQAYGARRGVELHLEGALSELAFARMTGHPLAAWYAYTNGPLAALPADVGGYMVRSTRHRQGRLLLHPQDAERHPRRQFALVLIACPWFASPGWLTPAEVREEWWDSSLPWPCWAVPQAHLHRWGTRSVTPGGPAARASLSGG